MKALIIALTFLLIGKTSFCQDWIYVGTTQRDTTNWYVKSKFVKKEGDQIRIWTKTEIKKKEIIKDGKTSTYTDVIQLVLMVADCKERKSKNVSTTIYDSEGKVIISLTIPDYEQEWIDVVPDTIGETVLDKICELHNK